MSHSPVGGHPQGWDHKLADRSSLPPASGEEKSKSQPKNVFTQPFPAKMGQWRGQTEGSSGSSGRSPASPPYMRWARSLHELLEDAEGVRLFRKFVCGAGGLHVDRLNFYFAVQGLRQETEPGKIRQVVSAIYKFLRKSQLAMPEELKQHVKQSLKDGVDIERTIFDNMEQEVTRSITESTYQAFLRSEAYVSYVSAATQPLSSPDSPPQYREMSPPAQPLAGLATLHEEQELAAGALPARLTHGALLATQGRRLRSDVAPHRKRSVYSAHVTYAGYCPTSRQDSSRASFSSGRTDSDAVSLSGSSVDGMSMRGLRDTRDRHRSRPHGLDRNAIINMEPDTAMVIPRTQRIQSEQLRVLPPNKFAPLLIEKLERVRREQENKERLERRLAEGMGDEASCGQALPPALVAAAIREKLQLDDDNDQDILDQHVSRVWSERTPGASPPGGRRRPRPAPEAPARRAPSALSADSGHYDAPPDMMHHPHSLQRRFSKKTAATELTDSGVSVVSERTSAADAEPRILLWIAAGEPERDEHRRRERRARGGGSKSSSTSGGGGGGGGGGEHTVLVVSFLDEQVPYRFKVPAAPLTLKLLKEYLPRKGNYRYFFKTNCADLDTVIQEEVSNDNDPLPMFEGKVMARVKSIE
ncbi:axin isoform X2 [Amyelois transitella]|uniref:axin isoform X2 n=1 Tax=Amyelois transitella TaxID=680683 RepID=UPI00067B6AA1|nr:axin isoform X2 [Amyelois transitella]